MKQKWQSNWEDYIQLPNLFHDSMKQGTIFIILLKSISSAWMGDILPLIGWYKGSFIQDFIIVPVIEYIQQLLNTFSVQM